MMNGFAARGAGVTETGRVRETNEDRILVLDRAGRGAALYAVADGLGGHAAGNLASELAVATLRDAVPALIARRVPPREALVRALRQANALIRERAAAPERSGMATTCTAVVVDGREGVVAHVGDSRAYLIRGLEVRQLTADHSLVAELVRQGGLAPHDAGTHAQRHVLTRALGTEDDVQADVIAVPLRAGDIIVLSSDGLHAPVAPEEMAAVIRGTPDLAEACRILAGLANARGGLDNASAVVVRLRPRWAARAARIAAPLALAALLAAGGGAYRLEHSYFLGVHGDRVAVMRGVPARPLGIALFSVLRVTPVQVAQIAPAYRSRLLHGIPAQSPADAETLLRDLLDRP
jgi:serine/threonine protein phosphatase PrpC